ncbi:phosphoserine aminotransferase [Heliomicrobium modesticaldum Ice1]|uniref:Phosphoserine aminotransferase n=1 Tax=Heliobacterium modesticaldum (strain ATCC 51547 / Ice1) TaxID=498761 RepID=B0TG97_HELMI|nr:3-phosphoserine/phosphohydroxythreonine transaminase [Heliomicrobium modesticaldum]ABZ84593.1 phosphoserine aminotransferase [Heliomicrobium modesticaldum Ice1]
MERVFNFNAGPATLPLAVLEEAQRELLNYKGTGMSVMEISHRSKEYEAINNEAEANMKELLGLGSNYRVLFLQGGASTQFAMVPMNFLGAGQKADYILTGSWSEKALKEAQKIGQTHVAATTQEGNYVRIPKADEIQLSEAPAYIHLTSNNTIFGTQWQSFPDFGDIPLIADMSSDILCKPFDANKFALIYAGAQKNLGPSGVTVVIIRQDMIEKASTKLPSMLRYDIHAKNNSLYNTPPSFSVYMVNLVLCWLKAQGGLAAMEKHNLEKAALIYDVIDSSNGFYKGHADKDSRSIMNITFRLLNEDLEKAFASEATKAGLIGLKGHRSVGGMRASIYNAMSREGCQALADFMKEFMRKNG